MKGTEQHVWGCLERMADGDFRTLPALVSIIGHGGSGCVYRGLFNNREAPRCRRSASVAGSHKKTRGWRHFWRRASRRHLTCWKGPSGHQQNLISMNCATASQNQVFSKAFEVVPGLVKEMKKMWVLFFGEMFPNLFHCFHATWGQEIVAFPMGNHWPSWWIFQPA